jgi:hypothetical protein
MALRARYSVIQRLFLSFTNNNGVTEMDGEREWGWSSLGTEFE